MRKQIKTIVSITLFTLLIGLTSCSKDEVNSIQPNEVEGSWKVVYYLENGNKITKTEKPTWPNVNDGEITLKLTEINEEGERFASGHTVSNLYNGEYEFKENKSISFSVISTLINEPEWTKLYQLHKVNRYDIIEGNLILYYDNVSIVLERN
ncbi:hypothetical protein [uncultured Tenacibaculum sp.]|uniref:hypothetical protein n=1 Tax=uncultured Tenacibaculum sp. TaxID=174713 RepID=UPI00260233F7|nr:hypothetical protein [uncultured Tenacibaculum sp.]